MFRAGHGYVHPPVFFQKANFPRSVAPGERNEYHVTLLALEGINGRTLNPVAQVHIAAASVVNTPIQGINLRTVRSNNGYGE